MSEKILKVPENYDYYDLSHKEKVFHCLKAAVIIFIVSYIFYKSTIMSIVLSIFCFAYLPVVRKSLAAKRKKELSYQFRELLNSLQTSLSSGKSLEMALLDCRKDLMMVFRTPETPIIKELILMEQKIRMNESFSSCLNDFADRSNIEDIRNFSDVISICRKTGGNLVELIRSSTGIISDKIEIKQDIELLLSKSRFESRILNIVPIAMTVLLSTTAPDYIEPIFSTIMGRVAMTFSVILLLISLVISKKIGDIDI